MPAIRWAGGLATLTSLATANALTEGYKRIPCASSRTSSQRLGFRSA
jgi:hypothetical protein